MIPVIFSLIGAHEGPVNDAQTPVDGAAFLQMLEHALSAVDGNSARRARSDDGAVSTADPAGETGSEEVTVPNPNQLTVKLTVLPDEASADGSVEPAPSANTLNSHGSLSRQEDGTVVLTNVESKATTEVVLPTPEKMRDDADVVRDDGPLARYSLEIDGVDSELDDTLLGLAVAEVLGERVDGAPPLRIVADAATATIRIVRSDQVQGDTDNEITSATNSNQPNEFSRGESQVQTAGDAPETERSLKRSAAPAAPSDNHIFRSEAAENRGVDALPDLARTSVDHDGVVEAGTPKASVSRPSGTDNRTRTLASVDRAGASDVTGATPESHRTSNETPGDTLLSGTDNRTRTLASVDRAGASDVTGATPESHRTSNEAPADTFGIVVNQRPTLSGSIASTSPVEQGSTEVSTDATSSGSAAPEASGGPFGLSNGANGQHTSNIDPMPPTLKPQNTSGGYPHPVVPSSDVDMLVATQTVDRDDTGSPRPEADRPDIRTGGVDPRPSISVSATTSPSPASIDVGIPVPIDTRQFQENTGSGRAERYLGRESIGDTTQMIPNAVVPTGANVLSARSYELMQRGLDLLRFQQSSHFAQSEHVSPDVVEANDSGNAPAPQSTSTGRTPPNPSLLGATLRAELGTFDAAAYTRSAIHSAQHNTKPEANADSTIIDAETSNDARRVGILDVLNPRPSVSAKGDTKTVEPSMVAQQRQTDSTELTNSPLQRVGMTENESEPVDRPDVRSVHADIPLTTESTPQRSGAPVKSGGASMDVPLQTSRVDPSLESELPKRSDTASIRIEDTDGRSTFVRVTVRGDQVRTNIVHPDRHTAGQLAAGSDQLRDALNARGFQDATVSIQSPRTLTEMSPAPHPQGEQAQGDREGRDGRSAEREDRHERREESSDSNQERQHSDRRNRSRRDREHREGA